MNLYNLFFVIKRIYYYLADMISFANAKINIGLLITEKRSDGYHNLETVFYPVKLYDVLELNASNQFTFETIGMDIPSTGKNLCEKAYDLLKSDFEISPLSIYLQKNIPIGAGLGGGSADAAFVLKAINELENLNLSSSALKNYAEKLGADCPFFVDNVATYASGIGATFEDIDLDLSTYFIVIIKPDIHISTVEAYQNVIPQTPVSDLRRAIQLPVQEWKYHIINDFELGIFDKYPLIQELKNKLYEEGALYASMSGSGSAVYGIFDEPIDLNHLSHLGTIYYPIEL